MKVLIAGASGLIGGRLIEHLARNGVSVRAASRTARAWPDGVSGCVIVPGSTDSALAACGGVDAVVNLAGMPESECAVNPLHALTTNAGGTLVLAQAARESDVRRFVQVSTAKVYGGNLTGVVAEDTPVSPASHYAVTHRAAEDYASWLHPSSVVFRLSNSFGPPTPASAPPQAWMILVNELSRQAIQTGRIVIRSSGLSQRNFIPMPDVVAAITAACGTLPAGLYNLGSMQSMSIRDMATRVADATQRLAGRRPDVITQPTGDAERPPTLDYRIDRLVKAGFRPTASIDDELAATIQSLLNAPARSGIA